MLGFRGCSGFEVVRVSRLLGFRGCYRVSRFVGVSEVVRVQRLFGFRGCSGFEVVRVSRLFGFRGCSGFEVVRVSRLFGFRGCSGFEVVRVSRLFGFRGCSGFEVVRVSRLSGFRGCQGFEGLGFRVFTVPRRRLPKICRGEARRFRIGFPTPTAQTCTFYGFRVFLENPRAYGIFLGSRWINFMMAWGLI